MADAMHPHGSIEANLASAVRSARRLQGHPVHADTLQHWTDLLHQARRQLSEDPANREKLKQLVAELEMELADHSN